MNFGFSVLDLTASSKVRYNNLKVYITYIFSNAYHTVKLGCVRGRFFPRSVLSFSIDVKESPQHDKPQSDQKEQFNSNIKSIQKKFADLLTSTRKSLKEKQVDLLDLVAHLMGFSLFSAVLVKQEALLADRCRDLENADSIDRIFVILSPFWSFLDYEILEAIIDEFGTDNDHSNLRQYVIDLKKPFRM